MNIDGFNELYHFRLVRRGTQEVGNSAIVGPMLHVSDDGGEGLRRSVMVIGRQRQETQERGDIESDAMAIAIIVDSQSVLCSLQRVRNDGGSGLFVGPDVVAEQVALTR